jgi:hypothetical protein
MSPCWRRTPSPSSSRAGAACSRRAAPLAGSGFIKAIRAECAQDPALGHEVTSRFLRVTLHRLRTTRTRLLDIRAQPEFLA